MSGAIALVGATVVYLWAPDLRTFTGPVLYLGLALLALAAIGSFRAVIGTITGRRGRYGANTLIMIMLFLALTTLLYLILAIQEFRFDTTATKQFTLAKQTVTALTELDEEIEAIAFFVPTDQLQQQSRYQAETLLYEFSQTSDKFTFRFVDPELDPSTARRYGVTDFGTIVLANKDTGKSHQILTPPVTEQDFTSGLFVVTGEMQKVVYFLIGHGERIPSDITSEQSIGLAARGIISDNYRVDTLNLFKEGKVPDDAAVVIAAGPSRGFLTRGTNEEALLKEYLEKGGNMLVLADPDIPRDWRRLLHPWGIALMSTVQIPEEIDNTDNLWNRSAARAFPAPGMIVDQGSSVTGSPRTPILEPTSYNRNTQEFGNTYPRENPITITSNLDVTFYPNAVGVTSSLPPEFIPPSMKVIPLAVTSFESWITAREDDDDFDPTFDRLGPVSVAVAVESYGPIPGELDADNHLRVIPISETPTRLVVFGDVDFASNRWFDAFSNRDFLLNSVNWLTGDYDLISIRPKTTVFRELVTNKEEFQFIRYSSLFLLPATILILGTVVWWRRH
jgi:ABC-type uncharacterized transport system involved in gliding motility auxiliary subunit